MANTSEHIRSMSLRKETAKWQFCKTTQHPFFCASSIILRAIEPCPCPNDIVLIFVLICFSLANLYMWLMGSTPGESKKTSGMWGAESLKEELSEKPGGSVYFEPICSAMNFCIPLSMQSKRNILKRINFCILLRYFSYGMPTFRGSS